MATASRTFRLLFFVAICLVATYSVWSQQAARVVVVSIAGDWQYQGRRVAFGQSLSTSGCLFATEGSVVLKPDERNAAGQPFVCEKAQRDPQCTGHETELCAVPLNPTKWPKSGSGWGNTWDALAHLFVKEPDKYMVAASRGIEPGLEDAVVPQRGQNVDLAAAFREMDAGNYWIQVSPVSETSARAQTFELQFTPHGPAVISAPSLQPGLYKVVLVDKSGGPAGSDCWILIRAQGDYSAAARAFQDAVKESTKWPEAMDPAAVRALLRAYLESLSISETRSQP